MSETSPEHLRGALPDGRRVRRIEIGGDGLRCAVLDLGSILQDVRLPGVPFSLTLGAPDAATYGQIMNHFGAVMGPVANRISGAAAQIDGAAYRFEANQDGRITLHSGSAGLHLKTWEIVDHGPDHVAMALDLPDGEGGFPGRRRVVSRYRVEGDTLVHVLEGVSDAPTLMTLAHHGYFTTQPPTGWGGQRLWVHADRYLPTDADDVPTGEIADVTDTGYDFRDGVRLDPATTPQLDNNFCLADAPREITPALRLTSEETGVTLDIATTAPGMQVFGMHKFGVEEETLHGHPYPTRAALALEPQMWPDAPGRAEWPSILLRPGEAYRQETRYRFTRG